MGIMNIIEEMNLLMSKWATNGIKVSTRIDERFSNWQTHYVELMFISRLTAPTEEILETAVKSIANYHTYRPSGYNYDGRRVIELNIKPRSEFMITHPALAFGVTNTVISTESISGSEAILLAESGGVVKSYVAVFDIPAPPSTYTIIDEVGLHPYLYLTAGSVGTSPQVFGTCMGLPETTLIASDITEVDTTGNGVDALYGISTLVTPWVDGTEYNFDCTSFITDFWTSARLAVVITPQTEDVSIDVGKTNLYIPYSSGSGPISCKFTITTDKKEAEVRTIARYLI